MRDVQVLSLMQMNITKCHYHWSPQSGTTMLHNVNGIFH